MRARPMSQRQIQDLRKTAMADLIEAVTLVCFIFLMGVAIGVITKTLASRYKDSRGKR